jgi:uncharacterized protein
MSDGRGVPITATTTGVRIAVLVQPRASRTEIVGLHSGAIRIRVAAPPVDGTANEALTAFLAKRLGLAKGAISVASGHGGRRKVVAVEGVTVREAAGRLGIGDSAPV